MQSHVGDETRIRDRDLHPAKPENGLRQNCRTPSRYRIGPFWHMALPRHVPEPATNGGGFLLLTNFSIGTINVTILWENATHVST